MADRDAAVASRIAAVCRERENGVRPNSQIAEQADILGIKPSSLDPGHRQNRAEKLPPKEILTSVVATLMDMRTYR